MAGVDQRDRAHDVVAIVLGRFVDRLTDISEGGEVDGCIWLEFLDRAVQRFAIQNVAMHEGAPARGIAMTGDEIVVDDGLDARRSQQLAGMAANIAGTPCHQDTVHLAATSRPPVEPREFILEWVTLALLFPSCRSIRLARGFPGKRGKRFVVSPWRTGQTRGARRRLSRALRPCPAERPMGISRAKQTPGVRDRGEHETH